MRETRLSIHEVALIAVTRGLLGVGIGLLLSDRLKRARRVAVARSLIAIGALSTIPLVVRVIRRKRALEAEKFDYESVTAD